MSLTTGSRSDDTNSRWMNIAVQLSLGLRRHPVHSLIRHLAVGRCADQLRVCIGSCQTRIYYGYESLQNQGNAVFDDSFDIGIQHICINRRAHGRTELLWWNADKDIWFTDNCTLNCTRGSCGMPRSLRSKWQQWVLSVCARDSIL